MAQNEYKARHDWVGKVIHREMCKKFKFDHANKWYMHNTAPVIENDTHKLLWDFDIQTDHLISARRPDLIIINKKKKKKICKIVDFSVPVDHRIKQKECEKRDKYLDLAIELKKTMEYKSGDHPHYSIIENVQNTEKSPGDLRRLAVTQSPVKDHQLTLIWKTLMSKWEDKQLYGRFKRLINNISHQKTRTWLRKETLRVKQNLF